MKFKDTHSRDMFCLFVGKQINRGMSRKVYNMRQESDSNKVIKVESVGGVFQNIIEWSIWENVRYTKFSKWFAPCYDISVNGIYLIQHKVQRIPKEDYPELVPSFFNDFKYFNFGVIVENNKKRFVCCDYGIVDCVGMLNNRMKKVKWTDYE